MRSKNVAGWLQRAEHPDGPTVSYRIAKRGNQAFMVFTTDAKISEPAGRAEIAKIIWQARKEARQPPLR